MTMRLIDADAIRMKAVPHTRGEYGYSANIRKWAVLVEDIDDAPAIDPESLRPQGEWISHEGYEECNLCHTKTMFEHNYCPNCGAKMKGGAE